MTALSLLLYLPGILLGFLIIQWYWPDRNLYALTLKISLGTGLGFGIASILHFVALQIAPGKINIFAVMLFLMLGLLAAVFLRERRAGPGLPALPRPTRLQWALGAAALLTTVFMLLAYGRLAANQPQGAFDAWAIWNRAARFIHRDPMDWQTSLSPALYWVDHPDYPLLVPLNIAWAWDLLGNETLRAPAVQAVLFLLGSLGLIFSALGLARSPGQASLGVLLMSGTPLLTVSSWGLLADVPIMYYILASVILIHLSLTRKEPGSMVLAGFMAGLAAWTKNEGLLFLLAGVSGLVLTRYADLRGALIRYGLGAALPLAVVLYFKSLAPPNDILASGSGLDLLTDPTRYGILLKALGGMALHFGDWPFSLLIALAIYAIVVRFSPPPGTSRSVFTIAAIIILQFLGSCTVYLLSPHDLEWHLRTSLARVILQVYPSGLFIYLLALRDPETIFS